MILHELPTPYKEAEDWGQALLLYDAALKELNTKLEIWNNEFKIAHQYNPIEHITSRIKTPQSIAKKMQRYNQPLTIDNVMRYINDIAGIRVICSFTSDIYRIAELIASQTDVTVRKVKDYIQNPKPNGYTSYHMIVSIPVSLSKRKVETTVEIQIRTIAMDFWASLEHKMYYKFEGNAPAHIRRELKECADIVSFLDRKMLSINEEIQVISDELVQEIHTAEQTTQSIYTATISAAEAVAEVAAEMDASESLSAAGSSEKKSSASSEKSRLNNAEQKAQDDTSTDKVPFVFPRQKKSARN